MKDIFYFIGFLSIAFHIYNFLYYDYIKETIANFINDNKNNDLNDIIAKIKIALNVIIPHIVTTSWLLVAMFTFNWLLFLFIFIIKYVCYILFDNDRFFKRFFSIINIILIIFAIYNTYYLKINLLDYCLKLI